MSKLHDSGLMDSEKPLYVFEQEVICDRLVNSLESFNDGSKLDGKPSSGIYLVPSYDYFISYNNFAWTFSEKVYITQEQVDKFIQINNVIPMDFIEFIDSYED